MLNDKQMNAISKLPKNSLINFIKDVYGIDKTLDKKIERLLLQADTPKLIKKLKTTIKGLNRRRKFVDYWEYREFVAELQHLKTDVMSLCDDNPHSCKELLELFMTTTDNSLERCDDSDGYVGNFYSNLADDWLTVASICYDIEKQLTPSDEQDLFSQSWIEKVQQIVSDNDYGTKDGIYLGITKLLSEQEIRLLIKSYESKYDEVTAKIALKEKQKTKLGMQKVTLYNNTNDLGLEKFKLGHALKYLAQALGDVGLYEHLFLKINKKGIHNPRLLEKLISEFLKHEAFDKAESYLNMYWPENSIEYQLQKSRWLTEIYQKQGNLKKALDELDNAFSLQPSPELLNHILSLVPESQRDTWLKKAYKLAQQQKDVLRGIALLLEIKELDLANNMAVKRQYEFAEYSYITLTELLKTLPEGSKAIEVIIYQNLISDILNNSRKKAYGIAARYLKKLEKIDAQLFRLGFVYKEMQDYNEFIRALLDKHGKKTSFWDKVDS